MPARRTTILAAITALVLSACGSGNTTELASPSNPLPTVDSSPAVDGTANTPTDSDATDSPTSESPTNAIDFAAYYTDNCAVCHGGNRAGVGRTPALTPTALTDSLDHYLAATSDRTHSAIWSRTALADDERQALLTYLATVAP